MSKFAAIVVLGVSLLCQGCLALVYVAKADCPGLVEEKPQPKKAEKKPVEKKPVEKKPEEKKVVGRDVGPRFNPPPVVPNKPEDKKDEKETKPEVK